MFDLGGLWAISDDALLRKALELFADAVAGRPLPERSKGIEELAQRVKADVDAGVLAASGVSGAGRAGVVAVIPVWGMITQHPTWLESYAMATSTTSLEGAIRQAMAAADVSAVVLRINSPGGQMQGLPQVCDFIRSARAEKPIIGHADSNANSAAYAILASCTEAWASPLANVGSIGAFIIHTSYAGADEKMGVKRTMIKVPDGKALGWDGQDITDEGRQQYEAIVAAGYASFVNMVAKGRKVGASTAQGPRFGQGLVLDAAAAAENGMLEGVRSFQETITAAARYKPAKASGTRGEEPVVPPADEEPGPEVHAAADAELELERLRFS